jgi:hypothetical protein
MTTFQWIVGGSLIVIAAATAFISAEIEKQTKHLSNIANRLLDIELLLKRGR